METLAHAVPYNGCTVVDHGKTYVLTEEGRIPTTWERATADQMPEVIPPGRTGTPDYPTFDAISTAFFVLVAEDGRYVQRSVKGYVYVLDWTTNSYRLMPEEAAIERAAEHLANHPVAEVRGHVALVLAAEERRQPGQRMDLTLAARRLMGLKETVERATVVLTPRGWLCSLIGNSGERRIASEPFAWEGRLIPICRLAGAEAFRKHVSEKCREANRALGHADDHGL